MELMKPGEYRLQAHTPVDLDGALPIGLSHRTYNLGVYRIVVLDYSSEYEYTIRTTIRHRSEYEANIRYIPIQTLSEN